MFHKIMVPVDLAHAEKLATALRVAGELAKLYNVPVCYVGVSAAAPSALAHSPDEYREKLAGFGSEQAEAAGVVAETHAVFSHDPTTDVDDSLLKAVGETGSDLVVMASHVPGLADYIWPSNGGKIAAHSEASVFVVRN